MNTRITDLAFQLADSTARSDIECLCVSVNADGGEPSNTEEFSTCWYDITKTPDPEDAAYVKTALEYLDGRGMLKRNPVNQNLVRVLDEPTIARAS